MILAIPAYIVTGLFIQEVFPEPKVFTIEQQLGAVDTVRKELIFEDGYLVTLPKDGRKWVPGDTYLLVFEPSKEEPNVFTCAGVR